MKTLVSLSPRENIKSDSNTTHTFVDNNTGCPNEAQRFKPYATTHNCVPHYNKGQLKKN